MHCEEEKLEIQSNGQKSGQMGEGGSKGGWRRWGHTYVCVGCQIKIR